MGGTGTRKGIIPGTPPPHAFPTDHEGDAFIACHGSWNSSRLAGYCIARIMFDHDPALGGHPCGLVKVVAMAEDQRVHGRPADCTQAPDGSVFFSTDQPGRVYRLSWQARTTENGGAALPAAASPPRSETPPPP